MHLTVSDLVGLLRERGPIFAFRPGLAIAALNAPAATDGVRESFPTLPLKAAVLFARLARDDVFIWSQHAVDGGRACMECFLGKNGSSIPEDADERGLDLLLRKIANTEVVEEGLAFWLRDNLVLQAGLEV